MNTTFWDKNIYQKVNPLITNLLVIKIKILKLCSNENTPGKSILKSLN